MSEFRVILSAMSCHALPARDQQLVQIVDAALADSAHRSGKWLACRPGCSQCCTGVFAINQLDVLRLRQGLAELEAKDPERAGRIRERAREAVARLSPDFPGDPVTGLLDQSPQAAQRWNDFAPDEPCPVLDPQTGTCELYQSRPILCRTFGPPVKEDGDLAVCELCFDGATDEEVAACELHPDPNNMEAALVKEVEAANAVEGETIVAFALGKEGGEALLGRTA